MDILGWVMIIILFAVGMAGAVIPVLPGAFAIFAAFFVYGLFFGFDPFGFWFWFAQAVILAAVLLGDYVVSAWGVKKYGGSRAAVIGSVIGIIAGPFLIPVVGLVIGPWIGAVAGEWMVTQDFQHSLKAGWGAVLGLFSSMLVKIALQLLMIALFFVWI
jgi:hypothetical protein